MTIILSKNALISHKKDQNEKGIRILTFPINQDKNKTGGALKFFINRIRIINKNKLPLFLSFVTRKENNAIKHLDYWSGASFLFQ